MDIGAGLIEPTQDVEIPNTSKSSEPVIPPILRAKSSEWCFLSPVRLSGRGCPARDVALEGHSHCQKKNTSSSLSSQINAPPWSTEEVIKGE